MNYEDTAWSVEVLMGFGNQSKWFRLDKALDLDRAVLNALSRTGVHLAPERFRLKNTATAEIISMAAIV